LAQREHDPEAGGNEVGKLAPEEGPMHYRGWVGAAGCVERELLGGPRGVVQLNPDAVVAQLLEVGPGVCGMSSMLVDR
jgi:hypothetical protein